MRISDLKSGQRLHGVSSQGLVELVAVIEMSDDLAEIVFKDGEGKTDTRIVTGNDMAQISVVTDAEAAPEFTGDPDDFRLAAEALRIKYAALYDPIAAVNSSNVDPLPHQIRAVYEELLPRVPLRFLLADDPGAGKTIMAGLYIKELILRSDCERAIIVAPGGLVEQWRDELAQKFDVRFEIFNPQFAQEQMSNPFVDQPFVIARMDQLSRNDELLTQLQAVSWDVAIVDEAHRMSARYSTWSGDIKQTRRFNLGQILSETAHHFLLMTATPHAGKEEDFQLFMSLLDRDRFEGQFRDGVHRTDTKGLMRRMVKEELLTFEGKPLFPERRAYTVSYELSPGERKLYEEVSDYVRTEMGRADQIAQSGDGKRGNNVGFALTVLQRRLASSPEAILRSLERRSGKLTEQLKQLRQTGGKPVGYSADRDFDEDIPLFHLSIEEQIQLEFDIEDLVGSSTAAKTIPELEYEITVLGNLIRLARQVRSTDEDKKWVELRTILDEQLLAKTDGDSRKIIVFTEHRDTLNYLEQKIRTQFGRAEAVLTIDGTTSRDERLRVREKFTHDPEAVVLLATDAAGEGLNLQRAHLMVNYDLPWNPNRIEQRFGRIHRIGQREVCHLWNLVAEDTREGAVFSRLLSKIDNMNRAYSGNLFNVLGEGGAFENRSLRDLLIEAIRYGDNPQTKEKLDDIIDASVSVGLEDIMTKRALHKEMFDPLDLDEVRKRMENARERKLQPGFISAFFIPAFKRLGGAIHKREQGRYEITRVPAQVKQAARNALSLTPITDRYERVTFDTKFIEHPSRIDATLIAPGHALLHSVIEQTIAGLPDVLREGTVFVDRSDKQLNEPVLLYTLEQCITAGAKEDVVSHHFDYVQLTESGEVTNTSAPVYLNYEPPTEQEYTQITEILNQPWLKTNHDSDVRGWSFQYGMQPRLAEVKLRRDIDIERTRTQVLERLNAEINHWDEQYNRLYALEQQGTVGRLRAETAKSRVLELELRLENRMVELDESAKLIPKRVQIRGVALVIPSAMLKSAPTRNTKEVERRAVTAVLNAERKLGRNPEEMQHNNPGFDIRSTTATQSNLYIEVKGRIAGSDSFTITANEVAFAQTQGDHHILALVKVHPDGPQYDQVRYITHAFDHIESAITTHAYTEKWDAYWDKGTPPQ
ncbi:helicase family protein [Corynebacterium mustelae]|uniref:Helicase family protein n=1 Tax=Corynebacterium mustelae TaxID=571915 RepID=A0A0G3H6V8_9CORY|nr:helicase-related protein [Corynebacterium mustelae]AKK06862.1 helicase family protein [Corynebacterium mustelae]